MKTDAPGKGPRSRSVPSCAAQLLAGVLSPACGGKVVWEGGGGAGGDELKNEGGNAASGFVTATSVTAVVSSSSGMGGAPVTSSSGMGGEGGPPPIPPLVEVDYGEVAVGATIDIDVPPNTLGLTAVLKPPGKYDRAGVEVLSPPSGPPVVSDFVIDGTSWEFAWYGITVAGVPQSDAPAAMPVMPGTWKLQVGAPEGGVDTAKVSIWRRQTLDGAFHGGKLDVNVFIADSAVDQGYMDELLHDSFDGYAGLQLGTVSYFALGPEYSVVDTMVGVFDLLEQTKGAPGKPALNIVMVQLITGELEGAGGLAAGIPGTGLEHGTHSSGVIAMPFFDPWVDRIILRHEAGHLAGLFHTTEIEGGFADALDDTPVCDDVVGLLDQCPDAFDLMFPFGGFGDELTPKQDRVIQGSSLYRGKVEEGGGTADPLPGGGDAAPPGGGEGAPAPGSGAARGPAARDGAWSAALPERLGPLLSGFWCGAGTPGRRPDVYRSIVEAFPLDAGKLLAVAQDPRAPLQARRRALALAGRAAPTGATIDALALLAGAAAAPAAVRVGAIEGLRASSPRDADAIAAVLREDENAVVARVARGIR